MRPDLPAVIKAKFGVLATILERKYGFDDFNDWFFAGGARRSAAGLWTWGDKTVIDGIMVNGTARLIGWFAGVARRVQTGYIYHYAFTMIIGVFVLLTFFWYLRSFSTETQQQRCSRATSSRSPSGCRSPSASWCSRSATTERRARALDRARGLGAGPRSSASRCGRGFQPDADDAVRRDRAVDPALQRALPPGRGRHLDAAASC